MKPYAKPNVGYDGLFAESESVFESMQKKTTRVYLLHIIKEL